MGGERRTTFEIQRDVEETRASMGRTLESIQERLTPGRLVDEALAMFRPEPGPSGEPRRVDLLPVVAFGLATGWLAWALMRAGRRATTEAEVMVARYPDEAEPGWPDVSEDEVAFVEPRVFPEPATTAPIARSDDTDPFSTTPSEPRPVKRWSSRETQRQEPHGTPEIS